MNDGPMPLPDTRKYAPALDAGPEATPPMARLVGLEVRKLVDTRSGRWLGGLTLAVSVIVNVLMLLFGPEAEQTALIFFQLTLLPLSLVLPVLGILSVTGEWSLRTTLSTFVLVPRRSRIGAAKVLAALAWSVVTWLVSVGAALACAAVAGGFGLGAGDTRLPPGLLAGGLLYQVVAVLMGVAFGMALLSTPLAIVLYFVLPLAWSIVRETVPRFEKVASWLDITTTSGPLTENAMTAYGWQQLGTSAALWLALPLAIGFWRLTHREVS